MGPTPNITGSSVLRWTWVDEIVMHATKTRLDKAKTKDKRKGRKSSRKCTAAYGPQYPMRHGALLKFKRVYKVVGES